MIVHDRKRVSLLLALALSLVILLPLTACNAGGDPELSDSGPVTLRILTNVQSVAAFNDRSDTYYSMYDELKRLVAEYEAAHENVTIELEFLPASGEEWETRIEQLRTEIMAGNGPDIYLMSPYKLEQVGYNSYQTELDEGLFPDVEQSMHNGLFYDISTLYDTDDELNIQELATSVMNAGVIGGARYMLPLRYTYPVIYADKEALEKSGMDVEAMKSDLNSYFGELLEHGDVSWFNGASQLVITMDPFYLFPNLIDYKSGKVLLTTMRFLLIGLPLILIVSYAIALLLKNQAQKHKLLKSVLLFPYIMPIIGVVLVVDLVFGEVGLLNKALLAMGIPVADWLNSPSSFWVVMALYIWKNAGYSVILLLSGLAMIPEDQYAAAQIDGASGFQQFWYITVPQMWYAVFFTTVFSLINAFKCFREIFLIGGTHPHEDIYMLQHFINNCFENLSYPKLAVASVLLLIVVTAVFALMYFWVNRKERFRS